MNKNYIINNSYWIWKIKDYDVYISNNCFKY